MSARHAQHAGHKQVQRLHGCSSTKSMHYSTARTHTLPVCSAQGSRLLHDGWGHHTCGAARALRLPASMHMAAVHDTHCDMKHADMTDGYQCRLQLLTCISASAYRLTRWTSGSSEASGPDGWADYWVHMHGAALSAVWLDKWTSVSSTKTAANTRQTETPARVLLRQPFQ
jgi:hypothetical protein